MGARPDWMEAITRHRLLVGVPVVRVDGPAEDPRLRGVVARARDGELYVVDEDGEQHPLHPESAPGAPWWSSDLDEHLGYAHLLLAVCVARAASGTQGGFDADPLVYRHLCGATEAADKSRLAVLHARVSAAFLAQLRGQRQSADDELLRLVCPACDHVTHVKQGDDWCSVACRGCGAVVQHPACTGEDEAGICCGHGRAIVCSEAGCSSRVHTSGTDRCPTHGGCTGLVGCACGRCLPP